MQSRPVSSVIIVSMNDALHLVDNECGYLQASSAASESALAAARLIVRKVHANAHPVPSQACLAF